MLSKLVIENYALIEQLGMEFPEGFSFGDVSLFRLLFCSEIEYKGK